MDYGYTVASVIEPNYLIIINIIHIRLTKYIVTRLLYIIDDKAC